METNSATIIKRLDILYSSISEKMPEKYLPVEPFL